MLVVYVKIYKAHAGSNFYGRSSGAVQSGVYVDYCMPVTIDDAVTMYRLVQVGGVAGEVMRPTVAKIRYRYQIGSDTVFNMLARFLRSIPSRSSCWRASSSDSVKQDQLGIKGAQFHSFCFII